MSPNRALLGPRVAAGALFLAAVLAVPLIVQGHYDRNLLNVSLINVLLVLGFNFTFGYSGQLSLGHIGFFGIGAYASGLITTDLGGPPLVGMAVGLALSAIAALGLAALTVGLHTHYLALATLGFGQIVNVILLNWKDLTHGASGVLRIPPLSVGPFAASGDIQIYYALLSVVLLSILFSWRFEATRAGRAARLTKQSDLAAESVGIRTTRLKVTALMISAVYASAAGSLYAHAFTFISPDVFSFPLMVTVLAMLVIGGSGTVSGAVLGALVLTFLPEYLRALGGIWLLAYGIGVLVMVVYMPYGIAGFIARVMIPRLARLRPAPVRADPDPAPGTDRTGDVGAGR